MRQSRSTLEVARVGERSAVVGLCSQSPLRLLAPSNHGHAPWVYQSSHGGGFVGDDDLSLAVDVGPGAALFLTTQASSKVYRGARARFELEASVGAGGTLVSWPDPLVCFAGSSFEQAQRFALGEGASLVCVDALGAGRVARDERWAFDSLSSRIDLDVGGAPCLREALWLSAAQGDLAARLGPADALATVLLAGPKLAGACDAIDAALRASAPGPPPLVASSRWPWGSVLRLAAPSTESLARALGRLLRPSVRDLLGDDPWARKW